MKNLLLIIVLFFSLSACSKDNDYHVTPNFKNNQLPSVQNLRDGKLNILFIGSSWMRNTFYLTNKVFIESDIDVTIGGLYAGGIDFMNLVKFSRSNKNMEYYYSQNGSDWIISQQNIFNVLRSQNWDIIVIQQAAAASFYANTYQPYLNEFRDYLISNSTNKKVCLVLNQTWTPAKNGPYVNSFGFNDQLTMYIDSFRACKSAINSSGIDIVIPSGQAVYLLRNSSLENDMDLTIDNLHLDPGAGEYLTACTVFMCLAYPIFGKSIENNSFRTNKGYVPVLDQNALIIQTCAIKAFNEPFALINDK